jgi:hypothetical protein
VPVYDDIKAIFIHIPKTGGSSIEYALRQVSSQRFYDGNVMNSIIFEDVKYAPQHLPLKYFIQNEKSIVSRYDIFTVVRNPYRRVISEYFWCMRTTYDEFDSWLKKYILKNDTDHSVSQSKFLDVYGVDKMCRIIKLEEIDREWKLLTSQMKIEVPLPRHNANSSGNKVILKDFQKEMIYKKYKHDFDLYGYNK